MTPTRTDDFHRGDGGGGKMTCKWKGRTHFNFIAGTDRLRAVPVVIHLLPEDIDWFAQDPSLFDELQRWLQSRAMGPISSRDRDAGVQKSRKRARKEELCVQAERLQFTFRYRKTFPRYTLLSFAEDEVIARKTPIVSSDGRGPGFDHLPLSETTLLVWVYRFDAKDPYLPVPNEAALNFAPESCPAVPHDSIETCLGGNASASGGPRDRSMLTWLWGGTQEGEAASARGNSSTRGGVRQHFVGSTRWEGRQQPEDHTSAGQREEQELQRAISLSLQEVPETSAGSMPSPAVGDNGRPDIVDVDQD